MRLLEVQQDRTLHPTKDVHEDDGLPAYAILSHTWQEGEEVTLDDLKHGTGNHKAGYNKLRFCAEQAQRDGLRYIWVDTCCINKADVVELQDAINSMFRWYRDAARCYVFLADVPGPVKDTTTATGTPALERAFRSSRWFTRGWTLQELLAPRALSFFDRDGKPLGSRHELKHRIHDITGIPVPALSGASLDNFSIEERLSWSTGRRTTRKEDRAYSLLGLFNIIMPLLYGEGEEKAFRRLKKAIEEESQDRSRDLLSKSSAVTATVSPVMASKPCYVLSFVKNRYFVGRSDELQTLNQKLLIDRDCDRLSIVGLGGTGKTQLALQFAYKVKETMSAVSIFWMPALSMESFEQACAGIVTALQIGRTGAAGEEDAKVLVREHLSSDHAGRWLLIVDNADDHDLLFGSNQNAGILDYLPEGDKGMTLFTTRVQEVAVSLSRGDILELGPMSRRDAAAFLEKSLIKKNLIEESEAASQLLAELACLPLAISQAAAYLNMNKISIAKYMQLLNSTEQSVVRLMSMEFHDHTRYKGSANAVAMTWVVTFSQIRERDAAAADLLAFLSCIEWRAIPRSLLPSLQSGEQTEAPIEEAIGTLCGYSFLARREDDLRGTGSEEWYDMHRLVHLAARFWMSKHENNAHTTGNALQHITKCFPSDDYANRTMWRAYMPHALRLLESAQTDDKKTRSKLSLLVGRCLRVDGRIREAVAWLEESYRWRASELEEDDADRLLTEHVLAMAYHADGQVKQAVTLLEQIVAVKEKVFAEDHPSRLVSQHELGVVYQADGQIKQAVMLLEHVLTVREKVLAEDHPDRLASQHVLAIAYEADGRVKQAVTLLEQIVAVEEKVLVEDHLDQLASQHELAAAYQADGQIKQAVTLLENVVAIKEKVLAEDHPSRLASQHELARVYTADGQVKQAVTLLEHVVAVEARSLRADHPSRIISIEALERAKARLVAETN
ncbi:kinesin light chain 1 [Phaeosphaeriaceae sp. SRC1lsM3a]|nr:kinesin light chain 1 [Stagonospora sp. SRC1lsM3a]